jgi:hypothetical protein
MIARSSCSSPEAFHVPTIVAGVTALEMAQGDGVLTPAQIEKAMIVGGENQGSRCSHKAGARIAFGTDMGVGPVSKHARPIERIFCPASQA